VKCGRCGEEKPERLQFKAAELCLRIQCHAWILIEWPTKPRRDHGVEAQEDETNAETRTTLPRSSRGWQSLTEDLWRSTFDAGCGSQRILEHSVGSDGEQENQRASSNRVLECVVQKQKPR
jgi:hypothetical protein